jgi:hypothetical protein
MRLYTFTNFYLSSIQQGIQSAHCLHDLFLNYNNPNQEADHILLTWAEYHKTMIVLNGGDSLSLAELYAELLPLATDREYPIGTFSEDARSLNNALTCVGIVLPASVYEIDLRDEPIPPLTYNDTDVKIREILNRYHLAR